MNHFHTFKNRGLMFAISFPLWTPKFTVRRHELNQDSSLRKLGFRLLGEDGGHGRGQVRLAQGLGFRVQG